MRYFTISLDTSRPILSCETPLTLQNFTGSSLSKKVGGKPAQETLYYEVRLGSNGRKFQEQASTVGALVNKIIFLEEFFGLGSRYELLLSIMKQGPNVEEVFVSFNMGEILLTPFCYLMKPATVSQDISNGRQPEFVCGHLSSYYPEVQAQSDSALFVPENTRV